MEKWEIPGFNLTDDPLLNDCLAALMETHYYFENFAFGCTLKSLADSFDIDAFYAGEDDDSGFSEIHEDDAIVEITAVFGESAYCLGFVFDHDQADGSFRLGYAHDGENGFADEETVLNELEPYFTEAALDRLMDLVMTSSYYFAGLPFGETLRQQAEDFTINAGLAKEDSTDGMCPVSCGEGIVALEARLGNRDYYMEFVFKDGDDEGIFYMCYGEINREPVEEFEDFIKLLEPFFPQPDRP